MPLNSYLRQKLGKGRYSYDGKGSLLHDREQKMTIKIGKKNTQPLADMVKPVLRTSKTISSGNEGQLGSGTFRSKVIGAKKNPVPMKMLRIAAKRG